LSAPEFHRPFDVRQADGRTVELVASADECAALARRFDLVRIDRLEASFVIDRDGDAVIASGTLSAAIVQSCAVSAEDLPVTIDEPIALRFVPEGTLTNRDIVVEVVGEIARRTAACCGMKPQSLAALRTAGALLATAAAPVIAAAPAAIAAAATAGRAVEHGQHAAHAADRHFGAVAVIARGVLPLAGAQLAFDVDLAALAQERSATPTSPSDCSTTVCHSVRSLRSPVWRSFQLSLTWRSAGWRCGRRSGRLHFRVLRPGCRSG
jgi:hypothetical protein